MALNDKTSNFLKAIDKYAKEQQKEIKLKANEFKIKELQKAEAEVLRDSYHLIQREMATMKKKIDIQVSRVETENKRKLLEKRREITKNIFKEAEAKLKKFEETDEYLTFLLKCVKNIFKVLRNAPDVKLFVRKNDMKFEEKLKQAFSSNCEILESNKIKIGGIIGSSLSLGLNVDESLDAKLENEREWFAENSKLSIV
ncbi:MAG: hypothetical protein IJ758_01185 [Clostridia bacterium]|nr:hypothetical protein [Clostridia bacterium]